MFYFISFQDYVEDRSLFIKSKPKKKKNPETNSYKRPPKQQQQPKRQPPKRQREKKPKKPKQKQRPFLPTLRPSKKIPRKPPQKTETKYQSTPTLPPPPPTPVTTQYPSTETKTTNNNLGFYSQFIDSYGPPLSEPEGPAKAVNSYQLPPSTTTSAPPSFHSQEPVTPKPTYPSYKPSTNNYQPPPPTPVSYTTVRTPVQYTSTRSTYVAPFTEPGLTLQTTQFAGIV